MNKVIFLDIDGVLNSDKWHDSEQAQIAHNCLNTRKDLDKLPYELLYGSMIDPNALKLLQEIVDKTGADIVISSTWRKGGRLENIKNLLKGLGFTGNIIGATPVLPSNYHCRGSEIKKWIINNIEDISNFRYVILDDDNDMLAEQCYRFVCVDGGVGLDENDVLLATSILNWRSIL